MSGNPGETPSLRARLNGETALIPWADLARFFARGETIAVAMELNLLDAAVAVASDDKAQVAGWMASGALEAVPDADARRWTEEGAQVWAVVVRPWILVQEPGELPDPTHSS